VSDSDIRPGKKCKCPCCVKQSSSRVKHIIQRESSFFPEVFDNIDWDWGGMYDYEDWYYVESCEMYRWREFTETE